MKKVGFWIPCIIGALITPLFFYASTLSGGGAASHAGGGFQIFLFYPIPFLTTILFGGRLNGQSVYSQFAIVLGIGLAVIQFPLFGFLISYANLKKGSIIFTLLKVIIGLHVIVSVGALLLVLYTLK